MNSLELLVVSLRLIFQVQEDFSLAGIKSSSQVQSHLGCYYFSCSGFSEALHEIGHSSHVKTAKKGTSTQYSSSECLLQKRLVQTSECLVYVASRNNTKILFLYVSDTRKRNLKYCTFYDFLPPPPPLLICVVRLRNN